MSCESNRKTSRFESYYTFDPMRQAVLLLGGDKSGRACFYQSAVRKAEEAYFNYLVAIGTAKR